MELLKDGVKKSTFDEMISKCLLEEDKYVLSKLELIFKSHLNDQLLKRSIQNLEKNINIIQVLMLNLNQQIEAFDMLQYSLASIL